MRKTGTVLLFLLPVVTVLFGVRTLDRRNAESRSIAEQAGAPVLAEAGSVSLPPSDAGDLKKPENLGIPPGPYDPVLIQGIPFGAMAPPANHRANDPAGENTSIVQSEVTIATHGDTVVAGWNDGIGFVVPGETVSGYGYSVDRGVTWVDGGSVPNGANTAVYGDPTVAVTNDGLWIFVSLDQANPNGLAINRGRFVNGQLNWNPALKYVDQNAFLDKEYIEYDGATDRLYMTYMNFGSNQGRLTSSTDGGFTWAAPATVGAGGNGYYPCPGVDGEIYVSWLNPLGVNNARLYVRYSSNGGQSWAGSQVQVRQLGNQSAGPPQCFNRTFNILFPSMSVDRSNGPHRGRAYMCWTDGTPGTYDCFLSYSDNKGQTWSSPFQLNDEPNNSEQFWPQVHVGPDGRVTVGWYDRRKATNNNSLCDYYVTQSVDGGVSWGPNRRLSDQSVAWCGVPANIAPNFGDYIELTSDDRSVFGIWSDARGGGPDVWTSRSDDRNLLAVSGTLAQGRTSFSGEGSAWFIPNEAEFTVSPAPQVDSQAQLVIASFGQALLATPPETNGLFQVAGEALHGEVSMSSNEGAVTGTFQVSRTGANDLDFQLSAVSSAGLAGVQFLPNWAIEATLIPAGPGSVNFFGSATMNRLVGPLIFTFGGSIYLDGAPGAILAANQSFDVRAVLAAGSALTLHTRTTVVDGVTVDVEPLPLGSNPPPLATVRATPNPMDATTKIVFTMTHAGSGTLRVYSIDGRVVRTLATGRFEPGSHELPFDGRDDRGKKLPIGGYFLRLDTDVFHVAGKLFVIH